MADNDSTNDYVHVDAQWREFPEHPVENWPAKNNYFGWAILPYRKCFNYSGRASRKEYWLFQLFSIIFIYATIFSLALFHPLGNVQYSFHFLALLIIVYIISNLAVTVRRLHDQDKSGWFIFINLIPLGSLFMLYHMVKEGTKGDNRFGSDPLQHLEASQ
jgi:uncharacterized membrane protein YhaH (DUF805 family)